MEEEILNYVTKLDLSTPGVFVFRLNEHMALENMERIRTGLLYTIHQHSPESSVILLSPIFEPMIEKQTEKENEN